MKPYYEDSAVKIYLGDCREILPQLEIEPTTAVVTDPPYGIDYGRAGGFSASHGWGPWRENVSWDQKRPDKSIFDLLRSISNVQVVWGGNYFTDYLPPSMGWLIWDKGQRNFSLADCELAWTSLERAARIFDYPRGRALLDGKQHPTQKPVALMVWCLNYIGNRQFILDPFMGSGTTLRAAKDLGRKAIGIEICEVYCEIAAKRMAQEVLSL